MLRLGSRQWSCCAILTLGTALAFSPSALFAEDAAAEAKENKGAALLQEAMEVKLGAESVSDLNEVIKLCQQALEAGLPDGDSTFAEELLASTLSQRAELICHELFETPITPGRGQALMRMALSDLEKTVELNSEQPEAQFLLGRLYAHLGQTDKALAALNVSVRLSEDDPSAKSKALMIRANLKTDPAERQADFDEAVKLTPKDPDVLRFRGMNYLTQNNLESAIADFNAAIELEPGDAETYEARGMAEAAGGKLDEALASFTKALEIQPKSAAALTHRARIRAMKADVPGALADVEQSMKLRPSSQALLLHASLLAASGKFEQALGELNVLRQVMPDSPDVLLQIAAVQQATKQSEKAIETYSHLIGVDAQNVVALRGRADAYLNQGQQADAIADYEEALKLEGENSGVLNNLAWVLATSPTDELRDGKRAIELAEKACQVTEYKQAHILSTLAAAYAESGDWENAVKWSEKAVELGNDDTKDQLAKELDSYKNQQPWREAAPPAQPAIQDTAQPNSGATPSEEDTARAKRGS